MFVTNNIDLAISKAIGLEYEKAVIELNNDEDILQLIKEMDQLVQTLNDLNEKHEKEIIVAISEYKKLVVDYETKRKDLFDATQRLEPYCKATRTK